MRFPCKGIARTWNEFSPEIVVAADISVPGEANQQGKQSAQAAAKMTAMVMASSRGGGASSKVFQVPTYSTARESDMHKYTWENKSSSSAALSESTMSTGCGRMSLAKSE